MEDLQTNLVIFQEADRPVEVRLDVQGDTVWLTQRQMSTLFDTTPENVVMHLKNIFQDEELREQATAKDFLAVQTNGSPRVQRTLNRSRHQTTLTRMALSEISIYETNHGNTEVRLERETVWLSQEQMAALFDVQKAAVSKHLKNIFSSGELERGPTVSKMETAQEEGACRLDQIEIIT